jgi:hypothetical protein
MPAAQQFLASVKDYIANMSPKPALVLGQSDWSAQVSEHTGVPMIVTNHDSAPGIATRLHQAPRVIYRKAWVALLGVCFVFCWGGVFFGFFFSLKHK